MPLSDFSSGTYIRPVQALDPMRLAMRLLRERRGLSQNELAKKAGVGKARISCYENGREQPTFATIEKLLRALDTHRLALFLLAELLEPANTFLSTQPGALPAPRSTPVSLQMLGALRSNLEAAVKLIAALEQSVVELPPGRQLGES